MIRTGTNLTLHPNSQLYVAIEFKLHSAPYYTDADVMLGTSKIVVS